MTRWKLSRRTFLQGTAAAAVIGAPAVHAQTTVLKTTAWGGKWGEVMKGPDHPGLREGVQMQGRDRRGLPVLPEAAGDAEERAAL
jgi:putative spermidine/putrescine transport system substrate-binding protein